MLYIKKYSKDRQSFSKVHSTYFCFLILFVASWLSVEASFCHGIKEWKKLIATFDNSDFFFLAILRNKWWENKILRGQKVRIVRYKLFLAILSLHFTILTFHWILSLNITILINLQLQVIAITVYASKSNSHCGEDLKCGQHTGNLLYHIREGLCNFCTGSMECM